MQFAGAYDADCYGSVRPDSERIYVIAKECEKNMLDKYSQPYYDTLHVKKFDNQIS